MAVGRCGSPERHRRHSQLAPLAYAPRPSSRPGPGDPGLVPGVCRVGAGRRNLGEFSQSRRVLPRRFRGLRRAGRGQHRCGALSGDARWRIDVGQLTGQDGRRPFQNRPGDRRDCDGDHDPRFRSSCGLHRHACLGGSADAGRLPDGETRRHQGGMEDRTDASHRDERHLRADDADPASERSARRGGDFVDPVHHPPVERCHDQALVDSRTRRPDRSRSSENGPAQRGRRPSAVRKPLLRRGARVRGRAPGGDE